MATKVPNIFLNKILDSNKYYIIETTMGLCFMATESLDKKKYYIKTGNNSISYLAKKLKDKYVKANLQTIISTLEELKNLDILKEDDDNAGWILIDMADMHKKQNATLSKTSKGFTRIVDWFFSKDFAELTSVEKRVCLVMAILKNSRASKFYRENSFVVNLLNLKNDSLWTKAFKSKDKYYARKILNKLLNKDFIVSLEDKLFIEEERPSSVTKFIFNFSCNLFNKIKRELLEEEEIQRVLLLNPADYTIVKNIIKIHTDAGKDLKISDLDIMHIVQNIAPLEYYLKYEVAMGIINKLVSIQVYNNTNDIKSLSSYIKGIVKNVIARYNLSRKLVKTAKEAKEAFLTDSINSLSLI